MTLIDKLLGKKRPELKARCPITQETIENGYGFMLTTAQVVSSKKYWDMVMTEPETLSYTVSHFKNQVNGTHMRSLIFEKYSSIEKPWIISDSCINLFDVDKHAAREHARKWWESNGNFIPGEAGPATDHLDPDNFKTWRDYAILEAGRTRISL